MEKLVENIIKDVPILKPLIMDLINNKSGQSFEEIINKIYSVIDDENIDKDEFISKHLYFFIIASIIRDNEDFFNEFICRVEDIYDFVDRFQIRRLPNEEMNDTLIDILNENIYDYQDIPKRFEYYTGHIESHYGEDMLIGSRVQFIEKELIDEIINKVLDKNEVTKEMLLEDPEYMPMELEIFNCYVENGEVLIGDYEDNGLDDDIFDLVEEYYELEYFRSGDDPREGFFYIKK